MKLRILTCKVWKVWVGREAGWRRGLGSLSRREYFCSVERHRLYGLIFLCCQGSALVQQLYSFDFRKNGITVLSTLFSKNMEPSEKNRVETKTLAISLTVGGRIQEFNGFFVDLKVMAPCATQRVRTKAWHKIWRCFSSLTFLRSLILWAALWLPCTMASNQWEVGWWFASYAHNGETFRPRQKNIDAKFT